jgi:hypothetical protein
MRRALSVSLALLVAAGSFSPTFAATKAKPKPKPKPIVGSYTAQAVPDPTNNNVRGTCEGVLNTAGNVSRVDHPFTVPAAGTLHVQTANTLDWAIVVLDKDGFSEGSSDGTSPDSKEALDLPFKKKEPVTIRVCNFAGEPSVVVSYRFTFK